jgi:hypothetical protein
LVLTYKGSSYDPVARSLWWRWRKGNAPLEAKVGLVAWKSLQDDGAKARGVDLACVQDVIEFGLEIYGKTTSAVIVKFVILQVAMTNFYFTRLGFFALIKSTYTLEISYLI